MALVHSERVGWEKVLRSSNLELLIQNFWFRRHPTLASVPKSCARTDGRNAKEGSSSALKTLWLGLFHKPTPVRLPASSVFHLQLQFRTVQNVVCVRWFFFLNLKKLFFVSSCRTAYSSVQHCKPVNTMGDFDSNNDSAISVLSNG